MSKMENKKEIQEKEYDGPEVNISQKKEIILAEIGK